MVQKQINTMIILLGDYIEKTYRGSMHYDLMTIDLESSKLDEEE